MKQAQSIRLSISLALWMASFAGQGLAQSVPQQVAGSGWQALTGTAPAVTTDGTLEYVAWKGATSARIYFSVFNGTEWTTQKAVGGTGWTAESGASPALADGTAAPGAGGLSLIPGGPTAQNMIDVAQIQGQVHAQSVHRVGELAERNPNETASIVRQWLSEPAT